ncbi:hypothetical protein [Kitasatospora sp. NPDC059571]|uniref:hypothetical protein n=1 Tax=Kitasatospora sp. NPDC059571 TaxID=3346871 RepID=UPI0036C36571
MSRTMGGSVFRRWWFLGLMRDDAAPSRTDRRGQSKHDQELLLREWEVLRDRLAAFAAERVTAAGDVLRAAELQLPAEETAARRSYLWALEAFEAAGRLLEDPADLPDLAAAAVLAERSVERLAAAHAEHAHRRPAPPVVRCFYNPLHGPAAVQPSAGAAGAGRNGRTGKGDRIRQRQRTGARQAAADRRPACRDCRQAILAGQTPDVLPALVPAGATGRRSPAALVPYFAVPQQWSVWSATGCGAYDDRAPALVLSGEYRRRRPH